MSIGFFSIADQAVIWRGPMLGKALHQLMADVHWGDLDYLVVDMPPGTGDVQITFSQQLKVSGALLVATPQDVALADVVRAKTMFDKVMIPIVGIVENMSYFICDGCGKKARHLFPRRRRERAAARFHIPYLGEIPITPALREGGDNGVPILMQDPRTPKSARFFLDIAAKLAGQLSIASERAQRVQGLKIVTQLVLSEGVTMVTKEQVYEILETCYDPEIPVNIVDLGLIYDVEVNDGLVAVKMTLTAPGCGMGGMIANEARSKNSYLGRRR